MQGHGPTMALASFAALIGTKYATGQTLVVDGGLGLMI